MHFETATDIIFLSPLRWAVTYAIVKQLNPFRLFRRVFRKHDFHRLSGECFQSLKMPLPDVFQVILILLGTGLICWQDSIIERYQHDIAKRSFSLVNARQAQPGQMSLYRACSSKSPVNNISKSIFAEISMFSVVKSTGHQLRSRQVFAAASTKRNALYQPYDS